MGIQSEVKTQLAQLVDSSGDSVGRKTVHVAWSDGSLDVLLDDVQSLACSMWQLDLRQKLPSGVDYADLGQQIAARVRYLLEPLQVHEVDTDRRELQLRSWPPHRDDKVVRYFEVALTSDDRLRVVRYEKRPGCLRSQVSATLTVEVLAQLCRDVAQVNSAQN